MNNTEQQPPLPGTGYRWFVVLTLSAAMAFSLVDRFALSLLFEPIKADLLLSDTQLGMLHGIAFGLFYATMGIPIAWLIDRWSRKWVIFWGVACWSLMTGLCGLAKNFSQLLGARVGVGVGEASIAPAGYSLIADIVPEKRLATAISIFQMGALFGGGLAFLAGGVILNLIEGADFSSWPLLASLAPWQITFIAVALPGVLFLLLLLFVREPLRSVPEVGAHGGAVVSLGLVEGLKQQRRLYFTLFTGNACLVAISYGNLTWLPSLLARQYGWALPDIGLRFGLVMLILAPAGVLFGGLLADRWASRGDTNALPKVLLLSAVATLALVALSLLMEGAWPLFAVIGLMQFVVSMAVGTGPATVVKIAPVELRARVSAVYVFMINIVGLGVGPIMVGLFSDYLFTSDSGILSSLRCFSVLMSVAATFLLWLFYSKNFSRSQ